MSSTPNLGLDYIVASQAQKEVTHNQALNHLDALVQPVVQSYLMDTPPPSPSDGDVYIIGSSPTGVWTDRAYQIAMYYSGWQFKAPQKGWRFYADDEDAFAFFDGSVWVKETSTITHNWTPGTIASSGTVVSGDFVFANAVLGDFISLAAPYDLQGLIVSSYVSVAGYAEIAIFNPMPASITLSSGDWKVKLHKR